MQQLKTHPLLLKIWRYKKLSFLVIALLIIRYPTVTMPWSRRSTTIKFWGYVEPEEEKPFRFRGRRNGSAARLTEIDFVWPPGGQEVEPVLVGDPYPGFHGAAPRAV